MDISEDIKRNEAMLRLPLQYILRLLYNQISIVNIELQRLFYRSFYFAFFLQEFGPIVSVVSVFVSFVSTKVNN